MALQGLNNKPVKILLCSVVYGRGLIKKHQGLPVAQQVEAFTSDVHKTDTSAHELVTLRARYHSMRIIVFPDI